MANTLLLCDCHGTQMIDTDAIKASGLAWSRCRTALCTSELGQVATALQAGDVIVACGQERAVFEDLAQDQETGIAGCVDLRDRAGWSEQGAEAGPKMAALAAEAVLPASHTPVRDVVSEGVCLIVGSAGVVLPLAERLAPVLVVTALVTDEPEGHWSREFDVVRGKLRRVTGALGGFEVVIDALRELRPGGRGDFTFSEPRDGGHSHCDIVIDVSGAAPLVPAPNKRDGYLRADPGDPLAVERVAFDAAQLVGTFEKPLYVRLQESLCAHSRAERKGCSNCLDICPTGAIAPDGDHVSIDPAVCAGCGACAALCPSTAITYEYPPLQHLLRRMETLVTTFCAAGGTAPRLLVHDTHGAEMIRLVARYGRGLPADVIPLEVSTVSGFGHAEMLAGLAQGFGGVAILLAPVSERDALEREHALAEAIVGSGRLALLDPADPDELAECLYASTHIANPVDPVLLLGDRRQVTRLAAQALVPDLSEPLPLPEGAPYGATVVDPSACTLCLSCVSLCPSGALLDNPDLPQLRFQESACLQCGICVSACPESAISLQPRLDLSEAALAQRVLNEEEPFACIECGALFGTGSTVERILQKLAGTHPMFATSRQARLIQMCDDCRVKSQFHGTDAPFAVGDRPRVRTSEDYQSSRKDH